jgi:hypothetical protein
MKRLLFRIHFDRISNLSFIERVLKRVPTASHDLRGILSTQFGPDHRQVITRFLFKNQLTLLAEFQDSGSVRRRNVFT